MYPYLTPFGIIMKINRKPLPGCPEDIVQAATTVLEGILQADDRRFHGLQHHGQAGRGLDPEDLLAPRLQRVQGRPQFVRDSDGQKAFSKLRSSIGGIYAWRLSPSTPWSIGLRARPSGTALIREANFSFLQSFAFCPYSPEAVFRYAQLLLQMQRVDDAVLVAETCLVLDPYNAQVAKLRDDLKGIKANQAHFEDARKNLQAMEDEVRTNPAALQVAFDLAGTYFQMQQTDQAIRVLDSVANSPYAQGQAVLQVARAYAQMTNLPKLEATLQRFVKVEPGNANGWYDLAALEASLGRPTPALSALKKSLELSAERLKRDPKALDLLKTVRTDVRFTAMRQLPQFQALAGGQEVERR